MSNFRKFISMSAVAVLGVTNLLAPLSYASAATGYDALQDADLKHRVLQFMMPNHNVYLKAYTEANHYFVQYSGTTKTAGTMPNSEYVYDLTGSLSGNLFTKLGYTFNGWKDGSGTSYPDEAPVFNWTAVESGVVPIYAQWSSNSYNITYNLNDTEGTSTATHTPTPPASLNYDQTGTVTNPSRQGYAFSGWNITGMDTNPHIVGGEESSAATATQVDGTEFKNLRATSGTVNFVAQWSRNLNTPYAVEHYTKDLVGTGWTLVETDDLSGATDTTVTPSAHHYTGFTDATPYSGNIDADGEKVFRYEYPRNSYNLTVTAGRGIASAKGVGTVNTTGATADAGESETISFKYQEPVTLSFTMKSGYTGGTWSGYLDDDATFTMPAFSTGKTASATPIVYTITYNPRSGMVSSANPIAYTVESGNFTLNNPDRIHSKFAGWTGGVIDGTQLAGPTMTVTIASGSIGDRSYTATWTCLSGYHLNEAQTMCMPNKDTEYTVKHFFENLEGTPVLSGTTTQTGETEQMTDAKPIDHVGFEVVTPIENEQITGDGSTEVHIQYNRLSYSGTVVDPVGVEASSTTASAVGAHPTGTEGTYKYGDTVTLSATLKPGYTFGGWTVTRDDTSASVTVNNSDSLTTATFTMPASSVTIIPIVTKDAFNIHYELNSGHLVTGDTNPLTYNVETATFTLKNPERDHSTFVGWSGTAISGTSTSVTIAKGSLGNRSYEAIWSCHPGYHAEGNSCVANEYKVVVENGDGEHGSADPVVFVYDHEQSITNPVQSGYDFVGWDVTGMSGGVLHHIGTITVTGDSYTYTGEMGTVTDVLNLTTVESGTVIFTALWTPRDDTEYVVYHYYRDLNANTYTLSGTDHLTGITDKELVFDPAMLKNKPGFTYSSGYATTGTVSRGDVRPTTGDVESTTINKYGKTAIYLYYDRNKWHVYLSGDAHVNTLSGAGVYEYGDDVTVEATPKTGYHFKEWKKKTDNTFATDL